MRAVETASLREDVAMGSKAGGLDPGAHPHRSAGRDGVRAQHPPFPYTGVRGALPTGRSPWNQGIWRVESEAP